MSVIVIGDSLSCVMFSTDVNGNTPSGDKLYIMMNSAGISIKSGNIPITYGYGRTIKQNIGKVSADFNINGFIPCSYLNQSIQFLDKSIRTTMTTKAISLYLWIFLNNGEFLNFRNGETDLYTNYSIVAINSYNFDIEGGNNVSKVSISASFCEML